MVAFVAVRAAKDAVLETRETMFASGVMKEVVATRVSTFAPPVQVNFPFEFKPELTVNA